MTEEWKQVVNFQNYEVSNLGNLRRVGSQSSMRGTYCCRNKSYLRFTLCVNGVRNYRFSHALVAEAFLGIRPSDKEVNHIDGNPKNNLVSNLEYITHKENMRHAVKAKLLHLGDKASWSIFKSKDVLKMRELYANGMRLCDLVRLFKGKTTTIHHIVKRYSWKHL